MDTVTMLAIPRRGRQREAANMTPSFIGNIYIRIVTMEEENTHITVVDRITSHCLHYLGMGGGGGGTRGGGSGGRGRLAEVEDAKNFSLAK